MVVTELLGIVGRSRYEVTADGERFLPPPKPVCSSPTSLWQKSLAARERLH
jgi:hypothetical protein